MVFGASDWSGSEDSRSSSLGSRNVVLPESFNTGNSGVTNLRARAVAILGRREVTSWVEGNVADLGVRVRDGCS